MGQPPLQPQRGSIDPAVPGKLCQVGWDLYHQGRFEEAEDQFGRVLQVDPCFGPGHFGLGEIARDLRHYEKARELYRQALQHRPTLEPARLALEDVERYLHAMEQEQPYLGPILAAHQTHPERLRLMRRVLQDWCLAHPNQTCRILEVGSWAGGSALLWAEVLSEVHGGNGEIFCVDPWRGYFEMDHHRSRHYRVMRDALETGAIFQLFLHNVRTSGYQQIIVPLRGTSRQVFPCLADERFQLVFIDGSHFYEDALFDIDQARRLVADGGLICGDDLELQAHECDLDHARAYHDHDYVADPGSGTHFHPGVTLAVHELLGEVSCWHGFWAMGRRGAGWEQVSC